MLIRTPDAERHRPRTTILAAALLAFVLGTVSLAAPASASAPTAVGAAAAATTLAPSPTVIPVAPSATVIPVAPSATAQPRLTEVAAIARKATTEHIPYVFGGGHGPTPGSPSSGLDCSGLVRWVYSQVGWNLGAGTADSVRRSGGFVRTSHPVPGDLIFFGSSSAYHVGIYISPGKMVDAPHPGSFVGLRSIYPGVMGYYHRKDATAFDSQPIRTTAHATVTVRSRTGAPVPGATVTVYAGSGCLQRVRTIRTDSRGHAGLTQLSGRYCLALTGPPRGYLATVKQIGYLTAGRTVTLPVVAPYAPVGAAFHALNGRAELGGVTFGIYRSDCRTRVLVGRTTSTRSVSVRLSPGRYCVKLLGFPAGWRPATTSPTPVTVAPIVGVSFHRAFTRIG